MLGKEFVETPPAPALHRMRKEFPVLALIAEGSMAAERLAEFRAHRH